MKRAPEPNVAIIAALAILASGCQAVASNAAGTETVEPDPIADLARDTLAADLDVPQDSIRVLSVEAVNWPNSGLGCPKPGMSYLDVMTPGHRVILELEGQRYEVHEAKNHAFICKQSNLLKAGAASAGALQQDRALLSARWDLAKRLGVPAAEIEAVRVEQKTWSDASLGCPKPGMQYAQAETPGWVLTLRHSGREFTYHADSRHVIPCPDIEAE